MATITEDKQLLLKDLCARLPYGVIVEIISYGQEKLKPWVGKLYCKDLDCFMHNISYKSVKPYLRTMSSMTKEEVIEFNNIPSTKNYQIINGDLPWDVANYKQIDWLLKNHFDFMGLIPKGIAIEVTEENNPYK